MTTVRLLARKDGDRHSCRWPVASHFLLLERRSDHGDGHALIDFSILFSVLNPARPASHFHLGFGPESWSLLFLLFDGGLYGFVYRICFLNSIFKLPISHL